MILVALPHKNVQWPEVCHHVIVVQCHHQNLFEDLELGTNVGFEDDHRLKLMKYIYLLINILH